MLKIRKACIRACVLSFLALLIVACGGGGGSGATGTTQGTQPPAQTGTIVLQQILLRAIPNVITHERLTGFDAQGTRLFGPVTFPKSQTITLDNVPIAVTQLQIEYLLGNLVVGLGTVPVVVLPGQTTTVSDPPFQDVEVVLSTIQITPASPSIADGTSVGFTATGTFTDNTQRDISASVTWSSGNPSVAPISASGTATGVNPGSTTIQAALGAVSATTTLTVTPAVITSIAVTPPNPSIADGTTQQFTATASLSDGTTQDVTDSASWTSSLPEKATINASGLTTGVDPGSTNITATVNGISGTATLKVTAAVVTAIQVTPPNPSIAVGTAEQFTATAYFSDGTTQDVTLTATWASSVPDKANVSPTGLATGVVPGQTSITASFGGESGQTNLMVTPAVITSITVTPPTPSIASGTNQQFIATANFSDGTTQDVTALASWTSSLPDKATVSSTGLAIGVDAGQTAITTTVSGISGTATLTVTPAVVTTIHVTPPDASIAAGTTQQFAATANFSDGSNQDVTSTASWTSSDPGKATINAAGLGPAVAPGDTTITATFDGEIGQATLSVTSAVITSISVAPQSAQVIEEGKQQFAATAHLSDGTTQDVTNIAYWISESLNVATISSTGLATGIDPGNSQIKATIGTTSGSTNLEVLALALLSLEIAPADQVVGLGRQLSYTSNGHFNDTSTRNISSQTNFTSLTPLLASFQDNILTGLSEGLLTVQGSSEGKTDQTQVRVVPLTQRISISDAGAETNTRNYRSDLSGDGRYVVFQSFASNLVTGDTNGAEDIFLADRLTGHLTRVSLTSSGQQANGSCEDGHVSDDGNFVAFASSADNLAPSGHGVFLRDLTTGTMYHASRGRFGALNSNGGIVRMNPNGRFVVFQSDSRDLVADDTNGHNDVFLYDRTDDSIHRVSLGQGGVQGNEKSFRGSPSGDGRYVVFSSLADNLVPGDTNGFMDVFVLDRTTGNVERVSVGTGGVQSNGPSDYADISADGRFVVYESQADNLVPGDTNTTYDIFLYDRQTGQVDRISTDINGIEANGASLSPSVSDNGRYVGFQSQATNLVADDTNGWTDIFVKDRVDGDVQRANLSSSGSQSVVSAGRPQISRDGRFMTFESSDGNLVSGDANNETDILVRALNP